MSKNKTSSNPQRKWEKKLRYAKTDEQKDKAETMLEVLRPKEKGTKDKGTKDKGTKEKGTKDKGTKPVLTDDQLLQEAIKENKKKKKFYEEKEREEKKKSLEREQRRSEILSGKRKREEERVANLEDEKDQYEKYKEEQGEHNQRVLSHKKHAEKFAEQEGMKEKLIVQHKDNTKKVEKEYKKFINKTCENIELSIQFIKETKEISYEEALTLVYSHTIKETSNQGGTQLSLTDKYGEEEPVQEDPIQEEEQVEELTEEEWHNIVDEHPELKL